MMPVGTNEGGNELPQAETARRLVKILIGHLGVTEDQIQPDVLIEGDGSARPSLGADSLDVVELCMVAEDEFNIELPDDDIEKMRKATFGELVDFIHARAAEKGGEA